MKKLYCQYPETGVTIDMRQVFVYASPKDAHMLSQFAKEICDSKTGTKCLVKWLDPKKEIDKKDLRINLLQSQVMIVYVTPTLLSDIRENGLPIAIQIMQEEKRPYFPVEDTPGLLDLYCELDRPIQGITCDDKFYSKLKEQLGKFILNDKLIKEIRQKAFVKNCQIFMSYRSTDTKLALELMSNIHNLSDFEAVPIWYDHFLTVGNDFSEQIFKEIDKSSIFTIAVTPNITSKSKRDDVSVNWVVSKEYPYAKRQNIPIIPVKVGGGFPYEELKNFFSGIAKPVNIDEARMKFTEIIPDLPNSESYSIERLYYLGRAYFSGYYVEQNVERAVSLFKKAAEYEDEFALKSSEMLAELYETVDLMGGINYDAVLKWRLRTAEICEKIFGKNHPDTATSYNDIGVVYKDKGDYEKALEYFFKALKIQKKVLEKEHPDTATSYNNIGTIYDDKGEYEKALDYYFKALEIFEMVFDKDHIAGSYNNIGLVYVNKGDYEKGLEYYSKALKILEKVLGKDHTNTSSSYNNTGLVYYYKGDYEKALEYYFKALKIHEKVLDKDHPNTAGIYNNIGLVYDDECDYEKALEYYLKALEIKEKILGKDHLSTATSYNNIGMVYHHKGNCEKALDYYLMALEIRKKVLGKEHPSTATSYNNIGIAYYNKGEYDKAIEYACIAVRIMIKCELSKHPNFKIFYDNLKTYYEKSGRDINNFDNWLKSNISEN
ncbi:MAG: DUF2225 domain-containing protein [Oscillospiraceae bacterium]|jgi:tetratricopeptide (TPR) repeat protein|nr:DUF2225 domain-containing protein [Oscillospiraceae bacterium]